MDLQHHQKLSEANSNLDSLLSHGSNVIENLRSQRFTLKVRMIICTTSALFLEHGEFSSSLWDRASPSVYLFPCLCVG